MTGVQTCALPICTQLSPYQSSLFWKRAFWSTVDEGSLRTRACVQSAAPLWGHAIKKMGVRRARHRLPDSRATAVPCRLLLCLSLFLHLVLSTSFSPSVSLSVSLSSLSLSIYLS